MLLSRTSLRCSPKASRWLATSYRTTFHKSKAETQSTSSEVASKSSQAKLPPNSAFGPRHNTSTPLPDGSSDPQTLPDQPFPAPYRHSPDQPPPRSRITNWVLASPQRTAILLKLGDLLGYGSPKQVAARRSKLIYDRCSEVALGPERLFWYDILSLPRSFQSWFTITNLHIWLVTVRLRALPAPHGRPFVQALIDHFFFDVEDRLRAVLGKKAPARLVTRQMKILREQWGGMGLAFDQALITGDKDMASAVWRNLLGARGASGIAYDDLPGAFPEPAAHVTAESPGDGIDSPLPPPPKPEDASSGGVSDFEGAAIDKYVLYPQLMLLLTAYLRRELVRLEQMSDAVILGGEGRGMRESLFGGRGGDGPGPEELQETLRFGRVKDVAKKIGVEVGRF